LKRCICDQVKQSMLWYFSFFQGSEYI